MIVGPRPLLVPDFGIKAPRLSEDELAECSAKADKLEAPLTKIGMPATLYLQEFGSQLIHAFDAMPYHVGSSLKLDSSDKTPFRDVDVRVMLDDEKYAAMGLGKLDMSGCHHNGRWVAYCLAFTELGRKMTGLPIDFQIQPLTWANETFKGGNRGAIGMVALRFKNYNPI